MRLLVLLGLVLGLIPVGETWTCARIERPTSTVVSVTEASIPLPSETTALSRAASSTSHVAVHPSTSSASAPASVHSHPSASASPAAHITTAAAPKATASPAQRKLVDTRATASTMARVLPVQSEV